MKTEIRLFNLTKVSTNLIYEGINWRKRKKLKDDYTLLIYHQYKKEFSKEKEYDTEYIFYFKSNPLDASNCSFMQKMIEDVLFEDDKYDIVKSVKLESRKGKEDFVDITIKEIN